MKKVVMLELDDDMKEIEHNILQILPSDKAKAMAIMIHLTDILRKMFGVENEMIIEQDKQ